DRLGIHAAGIVLRARRSSGDGQKLGKKRRFVRALAIDRRLPRDAQLVHEGPAESVGPEVRAGRLKADRLGADDAAGARVVLLDARADLLEGRGKIGGSGVRLRRDRDRKDGRGKLSAYYQAAHA